MNDSDAPVGCFIVEDGITYAGKHLLIDCYDCQDDPDIKSMEKTFIVACQATGATVLFSHWHPFDGGGDSGVIILAESHFSAHRWSDQKFVAIDIFVCGKCDPMLAIPFIDEMFKPKKISVKLEKRGII